MPGGGTDGFKLIGVCRGQVKKWLLIERANKGITEGLGN